MVNLKSALGADELTDKKAELPRALLAEFLGTLLLNFFGCGAVVTGNEVAISLAFGLTVMGAIQGIGHVSGGHVNPAVTFGLLVVGKVQFRPCNYEILISIIWNIRFFLTSVLTFPSNILCMYNV